MSTTEILENLLKMQNNFVKGVIFENKLFYIYEELITGFKYLQKHEIFTFKLFFENRTLTLYNNVISKVYDNQLPKITDGIVLQELKDESIRLDKSLIILLGLAYTSPDLLDYQLNNMIKNDLEYYILQCENNTQKLRLFVNKGILEIFGEIPNFSEKMELTQNEMNNILKKIFCFCKLVNFKNKIFSVGVYEKLLKKIMNLTIQINNCKIIPKNTNIEMIRITDKILITHHHKILYHKI